MNFNFTSPPPPLNWMGGGGNFRLPPPPIYLPNLPPPVPQVFHNRPPEEQSPNFWIKKWETKVKAEQSGTCPTLKNEPKISLVKEKVIACAGQIKELERLAKCLLVLRKSLSAGEWSERKKEIEEKKVLLLHQLEEFTDSMISNASQALNRRMKKRRREKLKREKWRHKAQEVRLNREYEHRRIDMWLEKMKEEVERARREESIKREADLVLSEVTQKKSEAKRMMTLLNTLSKLRHARVQTMVNRGEHVSQQEIVTFNQVIDKLKKYWVDQMRGYNLEEHGLRVMLNDAEVVRSDVEISLKKQILQEWEVLFFGDRRSIVTNLEPQNLEELIAVRYCWDNYACTDNTILATSIPLGWVVPSVPSNSDWATLLRN